MTNKEFEDVFKQKKLWCKECKHRTLHEYDPGDQVNKWQPNYLPPGWFCLDCGATYGD